MDVINKIFKEYYQKKSEIEMPLSGMREDIREFSDGFCLYGAGSAGIAFLKYLESIGMQPVFFVDNNKKRWGTYCEGVEIIAPEDVVKRTGENVLVIVTINTDGKRYCKSFTEELRRGGHEGVHRMLKDLGIKNVIDYTFFRRCHELFQGDPFNLPSCSDVYLMEKHQNEIEQVYNWLEDEKSKRIFADIVRFRLTDDSLTIETEPQDNQYFETEFFKPTPDEVFVDCGAYNGISLDTFMKQTSGEFSKYYGIEPDTENYKLLEKHINEKYGQYFHKMKIDNKAAWDENKDINIYQLCGPGSFVSPLGKQVVTGIKIDDFVDDYKATYIKMNIEGSELKALKGAEITIKKSKPRLAIAAYHKTWDLWEIPRMIKSFDKDYKLHLRSYMNHISFVYYGKL